MLETIKNFLLHRLMNFVSGGLLIALAWLVAKGILPSDTAQHLGAAMTETCAAVLLAGWNWAIHSKTGQILSSFVDADPSATPATTPPAPASDLPKGVTLNGLMLVIGMFGAMGLLSVSGCSVFATPTPVTAQDQAIADVNRAQVGYLVATTTVTALHQSGKIDDATFRALVPLQQTVKTYLDAATAAAEAGKTVDTATQLQLFADALARFTAAYTPTPAR